VALFKNLELKHQGLNVEVTVVLQPNQG